MTYGPIIDWWALPHIGLFLWLASSIHAKWEPRWWIHLLAWLGCSFGWELAEHFLQRAHPETWVVIEHPLNAWLMDPLSNGIGWLGGALIGRWSKSRAKISSQEFAITSVRDATGLDLTFGFSTTNKFMSKVIRFITRSKVSHAWVAFNDATLGTRVVMQAEWWGYEIRPWQRWLNENILVAEFATCNDWQEHIKSLAGMLGSKYDFRSAMLVGLKGWFARWIKSGFKLRPSSTPGKLMCAEAVTRLLQKGGYAADLNPELTTPGELLRLMGNTASFMLVGQGRTR